MKVTKETIVRTAVLIVVLINQLLAVFGKDMLPFSEGEIYTGLSAAATVAASLWAWWKNNSFTKAALEADEVMKEMKEEDK